MEVTRESEQNKYSRDSLEEYIGDYNIMFGCDYTTKDSQSFYNYYNDIARRVKKQRDRYFVSSKYVLNRL